MQIVARTILQVIKRKQDVILTGFADTPVNVPLCFSYFLQLNSKKDVPKKWIVSQTQDLREQLKLLIGSRF